MNEYLTFRRMITPIFIQVIFWIALVAVLIAAVVQLARGAALTGFLTLVLGPIGVRIYAELLIILFRMNDSLVAVRDAVQGPRPAGAPSASPGSPERP